MSYRLPVIHTSPCEGVKPRARELGCVYNKALVSVTVDWSAVVWSVTGDPWRVTGCDHGLTGTIIARGQP